MAGHYTGDGTLCSSAGGRLIHLGFKPRMVLVQRRDMTASQPPRLLFAAPDVPARYADDVSSVDVLAVEPNGFSVGEPRTDSDYVNQQGAVYSYAAWR